MYFITVSAFKETSTFVALLPSMGNLLCHCICKLQPWRFTRIKHSLRRATKYSWDKFPYRTHQAWKLNSQKHTHAHHPAHSTKYAQRRIIDRLRSYSVYLNVFLKFRIKTTNPGKLVFATAKLFIYLVALDNKRKLLVSDGLSLSAFHVECTGHTAGIRKGTEGLTIYTYSYA